MKNTKPMYHGHRFSSEIISHAVWLYQRICLSFRNVEDLLAERGVEVSYESIRQWCNRFGPDYTRKLKKRRGRLGDIWFLDEVFVKINYLWRAVAQDGDTIDILVQTRRNQHAAQRFFRKLLRGQCASPRRMVTDKLRSYSAARGEVVSPVSRCTDQYANNRAELSHELTRPRERQMRRFKSAGQAQRFLAVHGVVGNLFRLPQDGACIGLWTWDLALWIQSGMIRASSHKRQYLRPIWRPSWIHTCPA